MEVSNDKAQVPATTPGTPASGDARKPGRVRRVLRATGRGAWKTVRVLGWMMLGVLLLTLVVICVGIKQTPVIGPVSGPVVTDFTHLYRIEVDREIQPTTEAQIADAVRATTGPISIGGGRFSMGGQTATEGALHIDMRRFNRILQLDTAANTLTVQTGATWRQIQEFIDPYGLSVKVMQSYGNFTVGGSLSVNVHGRYAGLGPIISTVRSIRVVLADGSVVTASPTENRDLFHGAIGGYGGLGVITQATLDLAPNERIRRTRRTMPVAAYADWFRRTIRGREGIVFHNADIYPNEYDRVSAVTFTRTADSVTIPDRLMPRRESYPANRWGQTVITGWPGGKEIREHLLDPWTYRGEPVVWRNYEASYDVRELEPASRDAYTYVLQEYFVPVAQFDRFVPRMRAIFQKWDVNVVNVSVRHATPDPGSTLAWAPNERFAFVVWYKQRVDADGQRRVAAWTREMADAALASGGSWYLPYQPHATPEQFARAYPRAPEFFALKRREDPGNRFRNKLWDRYDPAGPARMDLSPSERSVLDSLPVYARPESQSYLAHPEWFIVYSADEYAAWTADRLPTAFPYVRSVGQFWQNWTMVSRASDRENAPNGQYSLMLGVIGLSYSVEYSVRWAYEGTIGRFSAWTAGGRMTDEDRFAHRVAADYARFIHEIPWYRYPFRKELRALWTDVPLWGPGWFRKWERRISLSVEYGIKGAYAWMLGGATGAAYAPQDLRIGVVVYGDTTALAPSGDRRVPERRPLGPHHALITLERYDPFGGVLRDAARRGERTPIVEIAGNDDIVVTGLAPANWRYVGREAEFLYAIPVATDARRIRPVLKVRTRELLPFLRRMEAEGRFAVDHLYDY